MKKDLIKTSVIVALLNLNVFCFANAEMTSRQQDNVQEAVSVASASPAAEQPKETVVVEAKPVYKNAALMERELQYTSGDGAVSLAELIKDKKAVLLDFYTTWCGPCKALMPELKKTSDKLAPQGVSVVGINVDRKATLAEGIKKAQGIDFPWLLEGADELHSKHFQVNSYPRTVLLGQNGEVLFNGHPQDPILKAALAKLGVSL